VYGFPTRVKLFSVLVSIKLFERFDNPDGLSDHSTDAQAAVTASHSVLSKFS